jgi:molybdate transport system substrate-binding protein
MAHAQATLRIAAAADLQPVMPTIAERYEHDAHVKIVASFGSSATLAQQITSGAPHDIFLSADTEHPQQLVAANLATNLTPYARGVLVLWARSDSPAQPLTLSSFNNPAITHIAIANDQHAPYGKAAVAALKSLKLYDKLQPKLVIGENISQTAQFALTGNAQAALISMTIARSAEYAKAGSYVVIPRDSYPEIRQSGVVLASSQQQAAAKAFLIWLASDATQNNLRAMGLEPSH